VPDVDEVEERDRLQEVGLVVGEEDHVLARQLLQDLVALDVDVVEDREVGDGEADAEAREQPAAQPAGEEGAGDDGLGNGGAPSGTGQGRPPDASRTESYTRGPTRPEETCAEPDSPASPLSLPTCPPPAPSQGICGSRCATRRSSPRAR